MEKMDSFTIAVLIGGAVVILAFVGLMIVDRMLVRRPNTPAKPTGK